jgi:uncharacterized membrane protein YkvA (DUF1232 family)
MLRLLRLWRVGGQDLRLLLAALRHPGRPPWLWPVVLMLGVYALEPFNFAIPLLGVVDDLVILPLLLHGIIKLLPAHLRFPPVARTAKFRT